MRFEVVGIRYHTFVPVKQNGDAVMAKCTCCQRSRIAVYLQIGTKRIFFYSGYIEQIAKIHFNFLIKHQNQ